MPQTGHAYAYGRVRVLENALVTSDKMTRVLEAKSAKDALKALVEVGYGSGIIVDDIHDYEKLIRQDLESTYAFVHEVTPEPEVTDLFFLRYDYHNAKVLMKAKLLKEDAGDLLIPYGTIDTEKLQRAVDGGAQGLDLPPEMAELVNTFVNDAKLDPSQIGYLADGALYKQIARELKSIKRSNKIIIDYFNAQADYDNVLSLLRSRGLGDAALINKAYLPLGHFTEQELFNVFDKQVEEIEKLLLRHDADKGLVEGLRYYADHGSLSLMEKNKDNYFIKAFKTMGDDPWSMGPALGYLLAKEQQAGIIRLIMVAKINDLPQEAVLERLRDSYE